MTFINLRNVFKNQANAAVFFGLLAVGFLIYFSSLRYGFYLDDVSQIVNNIYVHQLSMWWKHFTSSTMFDQGSLNGIYYKPVMMIAYSFLWNLGAGNVFGFRLFQLLLHCANAFLIFVFLKNLIKFERGFAIAVFCSFLFLVHPINSEAVLFIADLQEPLYTFFGLLALISVQKDFKNVFVYILLFGLSLLSKETGLLYCLIAVVYSYLFKKDVLKSVVFSFVFALTGYLFLRFFVAGLSSVRSFDMEIALVDTLTRLQTVPKVLFHYIQLFFYPKDIALTQDWVVRSPDFFNFVLPLIIVICGTLVLVWKVVVSKDRLVIFFAIWFLMGWGLHSQIVPLDGTVSDRWFYFTFVGFVALLALSMRSVQTNVYRFFVPLFCLVLVACSVRSYLRTQDWESPIRLYRADLKVDPTSFYLNNNLGLSLMNIGEYDQAIVHFKIGIQELVPRSVSWLDGVTNLAAAYYFSYRFEESLRSLDLALPYDGLKFIRLRTATLVSLKDYGRARQELEAGLKLYPSDRVLRNLFDSLPK